MGRRRLEIFGSDKSMRPGWLTVGNELTTSNYDAKEYLSYFQDGNLVGHHQGTLHQLDSTYRNRDRDATTKVSCSERASC
jgi:hypothetical protein